MFFQCVFVDFPIVSCSGWGCCDSWCYSSIIALSGRYA
ncbi:hypothetical protein NHE_0754 [Neorickettsia helminthoeca str. Oregon]|uniref:Uncharacterized protein n=1 Tax=Neorickettsia helminthoeca str. Oregon TaxID=1286528 RepID=X5H533_9RICK|nr:hypothetical protein NHE_0754 [Neorickettsia helminthoeca str. Oregon]